MTRAAGASWHRFGRRLLAAGIVALAGLSVGAPAPAAPAAPSALPTLGVLVAQTFLQSVVARDLRTAAPLCAERVDFDGTVETGAAHVRARLKALLSRVDRQLRLRKVVVMTLAEARQRFGPPPARLHLPTSKEILVAFGRFRRGGLIVFVAPEQDRYRVVALTD